MRIDLSVQNLQITADHQLQITSSENGLNLASIALDAKFIKEKLDDPLDKTGSDLSGEAWSSIDIKNSGGVVVKTYLISISILQRIVDEKETRGQAVINAVGRENREIVTSLLASGPISDDCQRTAIMWAFLKQNREIIRSILGSGPISQENRCFFINEAVRKGYSDILTLLLASGPIPEYDRGRAVIFAARTQDLNILTLLLESGPISDQDRDSAFIEAIITRNPRAITLLLASGPISERHRGEAVINAVQREFLEIVTLILASGPISKNNRGKGVCRASRRGNLEIVTALLASGPIPDQARGEAVVNAAHRGSLAIVRALLDSGAISDEDRGEAVVNAAAIGNLEIVTSLLTNNAILEEYRDDAIHEANRIGHTAILDLLAAQPLNRTYVHPEEFSQHPEIYLRNVAEHGLKRVTFMNADGSEQPGIDAGGLTKQFICQLADHLLHKEVIERDDLRFPCSNKEDLTPYTQLGKLLSYVDLANTTRTDILYIGEIFSPETYGLLQILARPEDPSQTPEVRKKIEFIPIAEAIATPISSKKPLIEFLKNQSPSADDIQTFKNYINLVLMEDLPIEITVEQLKEKCFEALQIQKYHDTLSAILRGLSKTLKDKILTQGSAMAKKIQGEIDVKLIDKIISTSQNPVVAQKIEWIKEKIHEELADPEKTWIKSFLKCVTGQSVIPTRNIEIRGSHDTLCRAHTCFCQLDLPQDHTSKEVFFERVELLMAEEEFGIA